MVSCSYLHSIKDLDKSYKNRRLLGAVSDGVVGRTRFQVGVQVENSKVKKLAIFCPNNLNQQREKRCLIGI